MNEVDRIKDQLRRAFEGEAWHGPSVKEVLEGVTAAQAAAKPLVSAHSIWEILLHVTADQDSVLRRLKGKADKLSPEEDWPPVVDISEEAWLACLYDFERSHSDLEAAITTVDESTLDQEIVPKYSSTYVTLHGVVQHNVYHAGQIALLKKG